MARQAAVAQYSGITASQCAAQWDITQSKQQRCWREHTPSTCLPRGGPRTEPKASGEIARNFSVSQCTASANFSSATTSHGLFTFGQHVHALCPHVVLHLSTHVSTLASGSLQSNAPSKIGTSRTFTVIQEKGQAPRAHGKEDGMPRIRYQAPQNISQTRPSAGARPTPLISRKSPIQSITDDICTTNAKFCGVIWATERSSNGVDVLCLCSHKNCVSDFFCEMRHLLICGKKVHRCSSWTRCCLLTNPLTENNPEVS